MKRIKVLMIDDNKQLVDMVKEYFSSHAVIDLAYTANDGVKGVEFIKNNIVQIKCNIVQIQIEKNVLIY